MHGGKACPGEEIISDLERLIVLPWQSCDYVTGDERVVLILPHPFDYVFDMLDGIFPPHPFQHLVAGALDWKMEVRKDPLVFETVEKSVIYMVGLKT